MYICSGYGNDFYNNSSLTTSTKDLLADSFEGLLLLYIVKKQGEQVDYTINREFIVCLVLFSLFFLMMNVVGAVVNKSYTCIG